MDNNLFFQAIIGFIGAVHANTHSLMKDARSDKITPQQHSILEYVYFSSAVTTSQIADCLNISLPNASRELKKLSTLDLITKVIDEEDRRKTAISLSEKGKKLMQCTFEKIQKKFWENAGRFSESEMQLILSSMNVLEKKVFFQH